MKERRNFSKAFKIEAVRLLSLEEKPATQLARELDIGCNLLYKWRDLLAVHGEHAFSGPGRRKRSENQTETEFERINRLEREVAALREERDILKKAAAYFARDLT